MNIQLLSDLHLEENTAFQPQPAPDADLLVLAGDIGSYQRGSALPALSDTDFGLARFAGWPVRRSPSSLKATIEGVVRAPSAFSMTFASLPSMTDTQELVVPRSIPITLAMSFSPSSELPEPIQAFLWQPLMVWS